MHGIETRRQALSLLALGRTRHEIARLLGVGYSSIGRWEQRLEPIPGAGGLGINCFRCSHSDPPDANAYLYLLGQYLGDGHIAPLRRSWRLDVACCDDYPRVMDEVESAMRTVMGASVHRRHSIGCTVIGSVTQHWRCVFPQHGPGMKHTRRIELTAWQKELVRADPRPLIRGLIHSDGCRTMNTVVPRRGCGGTRPYSYPRYFFNNESSDILRIYTDALDLLGVAWRYNRHNSVSVARRQAVAALDAFVGPKS